jgi:hypothetical protein
MKRSKLLIVGWFAVTVWLLFTLLRIEFKWNFFDWGLVMDADVIGCGIDILLALAAFWLLAKASRDKVTRVVSALICLALVCLAISALPSEVASQGGGFLTRSEPSPVWYRGGNALLMCVPAMFWIWRTWIRPAQRAGADDRQARA